MKRLGILGSTRGTNLLPIANAIQTLRLPASIEIVISNKENAPILEKAKQLGLKSRFIDPSNQSREMYDQLISSILSSYQVDLIVLIGYMRILSPSFVTRWKNKIINVHPSLLPAFGGKMDLDVHRAVLASKVKETGCTIHYVTEKVDAGPILLQKKLLVFANDTAESLKERVQQLEAAALIEVIDLL